jgi:hypothetical protein
MMQFVQRTPMEKMIQFENDIIRKWAEMGGWKTGAGRSSFDCAQDAETEENKKQKR